MKAQEYPIEHFKMMVDITNALALLPIQLLSHVYEYEVFGSWWFTCLSSGQKYRVLFDGRDGVLRIQLPNGKDWPDDWSDIRSIEIARADLNANNILKHVLSVIKST
jgi:hypothetical protein